MKITSEQKTKIEQFGKKHNLKLILIHGSRVSGKPKKDSDLDIAIMGKKPIKMDDIILDMQAELDEIFGANDKMEIDIKPLHGIDPLFCYQVAKNSQLLYGDPTDYAAFKSYAFMNYFDSRDLFNLEKKLALKFQDYLNKKYVHRH